ncbi:MAG TPA: hypothetical protein VMY42_07710 [Thermoguttaceae bacterium]|nr:hypothetical protein [Thermoguttaceae bacterium]
MTVMADDEPSATDDPVVATESVDTGQVNPADDSDSEKEAETVGEPLAPGMVELMQQEIAKGLQLRGINSNFSRFQSYLGGRLNATASHSGSELTGYCRLKWYDRMLRSVLKAPSEAEEFTRNLHKAVLNGREGFAEVLTTAAEKLDIGQHQQGSFAEVDSPEQALEVIKHALTAAQIAYAASLAPLTKSEIQTLRTNLNPVFTTENRVGHTLQRRSSGQQLVRVMQKMDRESLHAAAEALAAIADPQLLEQLASFPGGDPTTVEGVSGTVIAKIDTPSGTIVIGGKDRNVYRLDTMSGVNVVIDQGGNDVYYDGSVSPQRPVLIVIDLEGDDAYESKTPGVQGSAILGVSMLVDVEGNDVYRAQDVAQGSCLAGVGILIDYAGNDAYVGLRRVQGQAVGGLGILIDHAGNDRYHAAMWGQGFGGPWGFGLLDDVDGKDHYYGGGLYLNSYINDDNPTPGYEGWVQGVGAGLRAVGDGGVGVILDGGGDDVYEYDYLSHGGGYWCGMGFARDFGGNDQRLGATRVAYHGGPRTQRSFQRFSNGYGCHYALGFLFDDRGDDTYNGTIMSVGFAWDCAVGYLCDFGGNDRYSGTEGNGAQAGLGVIFDYDGDDVYLGSGQGRASPSISYHDLPQCGGNFGFVIDYGGTDKYGCGARNNGYYTRSSSGGFLIDRPKQTDAVNTAERPVVKAAAGS